MAKNRFTTSPQVPVGAFAAAARLLVEGSRVEASALANLGAQIGGGIRRTRDQAREDERQNKALAESARRFDRQEDRLDRSLDSQIEDRRSSREESARRFEIETGLRERSVAVSEGRLEAARAGETRKRQDDEDAMANNARRIEKIQNLVFQVQAQEKMLGGADPKLMSELTKISNNDPLFGVANMLIEQGFNAHAKTLREVHGNPEARKERAAALRGQAQQIRKGSGDLDRRSRAQVEGMAALLDTHAKRQDLVAGQMEEAGKERDRFKAFLSARDKAMNRIKLHGMDDQEAAIVMGELVGANEARASQDKMNQLVEQGVNAVLEQRRIEKEERKARAEAQRSLNKSSGSGEDAEKRRKEVLARYDKERKIERDRADGEKDGATGNVDLTNYSTEALRVLAQDRPAEKPRIEEELTLREVSEDPGEAAGSLMLEEIFKLSEEKFGQLSQVQIQKINNLSPKAIKELLKKLRG